MCEGKLIRQIDFFQSRTSVAPAAAAAIVTGGSPTREEIIVAVKFRNFFSFSTSLLLFHNGNNRGREE